jgi:hypothetical protein
MEIKHKYPINLQKWEHLSTDQFIGRLAESDLHIELGLTPQDPKLLDHYYINVSFEKTIMNETTNMKVLDIFANKTFLIENKNKKYTVEFLLDCIKIAEKSFLEIYNTRIKNTTIQYHTLSPKDLNIFKKYAQKCIDTWEKAIRDITLN